jgi:DNA repair protein SbcC/Rad50
MKIVSVKLKNISSLKGEWEIRFDQPPLADTGLFAIIGPNGSGKTSILDALTLALYGETPRLKDPEPGIINWQAVEAQAAVTFAVSGSLYRSQWSVRRINGRLAPPEMVLTGLNGQETILEDRVIKVRTRVAELTGLDFKRFCRSILLAQGEFTAFLAALENERAEVLEKIIGPELTLELEQSIRSRTEAENEKLLQLKETAASFPLLDKDQLKTLRENLEQAEEELRETDRLLEELTARQAWAARVDLLEAQHRDAAEMLAVAEGRYAGLQIDLQRLKEARKATPLREDVTHLSELQEEAVRVETLLQYVQTDIESYQTQTGELEELLLQTRLALDEARKQLEERSEDTLKAAHLAREIDQESERFRNAVAHFETLEQTLQEKLRQPSDVERELAALQSHQQEVQSWLDEHATEARLETDLPAIEGTLARLRQIRQQLDQQLARETEVVKAERQAAGVLHRGDRAVHKVRQRVTQLTDRKTERERRVSEILKDDTVESLTADLRNRKQRLAVFEKLIKIGRNFEKLTPAEDIPDALDRMKAQQDALNQSLTEEQERLTELEELAARRDTLKKHALERTLLKSGKPCPLCGALDHPYAEQGLPDFGANGTALQNQKDKVKALNEELKSLSAQEVELQARSKALEAVGAEWSRAGAQAGGDWAITSLDAVRDEHRSNNAEIKRLKSRVRSVHWQEWRSSWVERALRRKSAKLAAKEQARARLQEVHRLQRDALEGFKTELQRLQQEEQATREELTVRLGESGEHLSGTGVETDLLQRIRRRWDAYRHRVRDREATAERLRSLEAQLAALPQEIQELTERKDSLASEIEANQRRLSALAGEREELWGTTDPVQAGQTLQNDVAQYTTELASLHQELKTLRQTLVERQTALPHVMEDVQMTQAALAEAEQGIRERALLAGFDSVDEVKQAVLLLERQEVLGELWSAAEKTLEAARSRADAAQSAWNAARSERVVDDSAEIVCGKLAQATKRREFLQDDIAAAERTLQQQRDLEHEYREALQAVTEQEKICARLTAGRTALQSQDPSETKGKLQRLMLERLLDHANRHLETLNGRYTLRPLAEEGLGLHVEDALQERTCRSVKTLSGGESFLASLCLALGLSEMAAKDRKIESLFLDEGFGTLDDETLYRVMAALKGLRANGKMVGVISHVKRLADEIPTQIRVEKQPGGSSRISIVA